MTRKMNKSSQQLTTYELHHLAAHLEQSGNWDALHSLLNHEITRVTWRSLKYHFLPDCLKTLLPNRFFVENLRRFNFWFEAKKSIEHTPGYLLRFSDFEPQLTC